MYGTPDGPPQAFCQKFQGFVCPYCNLKGLSDILLLDHVMEEHGDDDQCEVFCPLCVVSPGSPGGLNMRTDDLEDHLAMDHQLNGSPDVSLPDQLPASADAVSLRSAGEGALSRSFSNYVQILAGVNADHFANAQASSQSTGSRRAVLMSSHSERPTDRNRITFAGRPLSPATGSAQNLLLADQATSSLQRILAGMSSSSSARSQLIASRIAGSGLRFLPTATVALRQTTAAPQQSQSVSTEVTKVSCSGQFLMSSSYRRRESDQLLSDRGDR